MKPFISVIIPSYNSMRGNECIDRLISSVVGQTYKNVEIIVIDNFSADNTREVCKRYPVRFFDLRSTISMARNYGLDIAKGDYIIFLDSDQALPRTLFQELVDLLNCRPVDCIIIRILCAEHKSHRSFINSVLMHNIEVSAGIGTTGTSCPIFYSRHIIGEVRFPEHIQLGEDFLFWLRVAKKMPKVGKIKQRIYHYEEPSIRCLIARSWTYGKSFRGTQKYFLDSLHFLNHISIFNIRCLTGIILTVLSRPKVIYPFFIYLSFKYLAFLLGYLIEMLWPITTLENP